MNDDNKIRDQLGETLIELISILKENKKIRQELEELKSAVSYIRNKAFVTHCELVNTGDPKEIMFEQEPKTGILFPMLNRYRITKIEDSV